MRLVAAARAECQRGQVFPMWLGAIFAMLVVLFFTLNYAYVLRWQVRAQNAADAAAQAMLTLQTQQYNQLEMMLYASAVEEFRVRRLLNALLLAAHQQGGCPDAASCESVYEGLRPPFLQSVQRYTNDVVVTNRIAANLNFDTMKADAQALLGRLGAASACDGGTGGDCAFDYDLIDLSPRTAGLETVEMDALGILKPSFAEHTPAATVNPELFAPAQVEVAVCAVVPPLIDVSIFGFKPQPFRVIGRAAATAVMVEQDWMQPGRLINPITGGVFQPAEEYVPPPAGGYDWYAVDFGGNTTEAYETYNVFSAPLVSDEFSAQLGWWNAIPIAPYAGPQSPDALPCAGS
jgi:hypothetical protein